MNFLVKLETLINSFLTKLFGLIVSAFHKLVPEKIRETFQKLASGVIFLIKNIKQTPSFIMNFLKGLFVKIKNELFAFDYKSALKATYAAALEQYKQHNPQAGLSQFKTLIVTPFYMLSQWLKGLSTPQVMLLLSFTAASFLSIMGMIFSGQRLVSHHSPDRSPASVEEEVPYERPDYYKKQTRHFEMSNVRLPVYVAEVNELRTVDIDFIATISNRKARMFLEKQEFQLRDHLILQMEPSVASFPLEEEGKEIIRQKLLLELNEFLKLNETEGEVTDLKLTYILAN